MRIFLLYCLIGFVCAISALPARRSYDRFRVPYIELSDYDELDDEEQEPLYEIQERSVVGRRNNQQMKPLNLERFKNIPLLFLHSDDDSPVPRSERRRPIFVDDSEDYDRPVVRKIVKPQKPLLFYARESSRQYRNPIKELPFFVLDDDSSYDTNTSPLKPLFRNVVPKVYKNTAQVLKPKLRPTRKPLLKQENKERRRPDQKVKPVISRRPSAGNALNEVSTVAPQLQSTTAKPVEATTKKDIENKTVETSDAVNTIEIPLPRNLEIVAFVTKDGSIFEVDNADENVTLLESTESTADLNKVKGKSQGHSINRIFVEKSKSNQKPEAVIEFEAEDQENLKAVETLTHDESDSVVVDQSLQPSAEIKGGSNEETSSAS